MSEKYRHTIDYFVRIAYDGTGYGGWQRQANHPRTIQQTVEESLSKALGTGVSISGCGRTDAGVHASQFYFYVNTARELPSNFLFFMNKNLPIGIAFLELIPVDYASHVCLDAESRTYDYFFHDFHDAMLMRTSSQIDLSGFKPAASAEAMPMLMEHTDYREFCLTPNRHNSTQVVVSGATLFYNRESNRFRFRFVANRFLRGMVRILVNDLLKIGSDEMSLDKFRSMLDLKVRERKVQPAAPEGLFLTGVQYPYINREPDLPFCGCGEWETIT